MKENITEHLKKLGVSDNNIEKGIQSSFTGENKLGGSNIKFNKLGKEIKEKLSIEKQKYIEMKDSLLQKIFSLRTNLQEEPTELVPDYFLRNINLNKLTIPKIYSWERINAINKIYNSLQPTEKENEISKYNDLVEKYTNILVEIVFIDTLFGNIEDEKSYELDSDQLVNLGF